MKYVYQCEEHGAFEIEAPMAEGPPQEVLCRVCSVVAERVYTTAPIHYNCQGFHSTDYFSGNTGTGTRADQLNKKWSEYYGEAPPPPATDVPTNSSDKH